MNEDKDKAQDATLSARRFEELAADRQSWLHHVMTGQFRDHRYDPRKIRQMLEKYKENNQP